MNKFKHTEYFDYDVQGARSNNCILIDAKNWLANMSNDIVGINSRGGIANNFITEVLATNISDEKYNTLYQSCINLSKGIATFIKSLRSSGIKGQKYMKPSETL